MYFLELDKECPNETAYLHFDTTTDVIELQCFKDGVYTISEVKHSEVWTVIVTPFPEKQGGTTHWKWIHDNFVHYGDVLAYCDLNSLELVRCVNCFRSIQNRQVDDVALNVVVFAAGSVDPEILATFDEEYARAWYLDHDRNLKEEDLISWQEVKIKGLSRKARGDING